ncbi:accessory factor UbiK family protein [Sansalvadorimonas verongulae]|uniref:accessory factor UbiK family protein n=1 Tax=Sansalvadorimonas verongulae TaxID=2172824 RepID=UPI0012BD40DB|nr:accessory factor UbiK family protein [Sansalvadorimonas verongulae]MTI12454.1 accessory factor UbiK family protein [Sansalvadorimonas verongulae]
MTGKADFIGSIAEKLQDIVGQGHPLKEDFEKNVKAVLTNAFSKMELLTREEFDGQVAVLQRTREMVEALEKRVTDLEKANPESAEETVVDTAEDTPESPEE